MDYILLLIGLAAGFGAGWIIYKLKAKSEGGVDRSEIDQLNNALNQTKAEINGLKERNELLVNQLEEEKAELRASSQTIIDLNSQLSGAVEKNKNLVERLEEGKQEVEQLQERLKVEFKNMANELLEEKSKKFTEQNKTNLGEILNPLNEKIKEFQKKVEDTHKESLERNSALRQQILGLKDLNEQMSKDALNLTRALKGDNKTQGNWGEVILERILEKSGLQKDREYIIQDSVRTEEGKLRQPDVVILLPDNKTLVIDSKVSLVDYDRFANCEDEEEQQQYLKDHVRSIKTHIKGLSDKEYHKLYDVGSPDFVLMFIPIEPAFGLAFQHDPELYNEALSRNIVVVSTSTLLATLRTISSIWRQEHQNKNALEIARQSGALYDKFEGFIADLVEVGKKMDNAKDNYKLAMNKLYEGKGNLIRRVENLKKLGAKTSKSLPDKILERAAEAEEEEALPPIAKQENELPTASVEQEVPAEGEGKSLFD